MNNIQKIVKKDVEQKKHPKAVNFSKESVGATTITKRILILEVNVTLGEILVLAPKIKKQLTRAIIEDEAIQLCISTLDIESCNDSSSLHLWYSKDFTKTNVLLKESFKVIALIETGVEINVMTREVMEDAGLTMVKKLDLELVFHTSYSQFFLEICEDVEVAVEDL